MKKKLFLIVLTGILILISNIAAFAAINNSSSLYPVSFEGKWGYVDGNGKLVIKPQYSDARPFKDGLAAVYFNEKWGYIDSKGKIVVPIQFKQVCDFSEGLAAVQNNWFNYGYIDKKGKYIIKPQFSWGYFSGSDLDFHNGVVLAVQKQRFFLINQKGKQISKKYVVIKPFSEGLAVVVNSKYECGYINLQGREVIKPKFGMACEFSDGLAAVVVGSKFGYIDHSGKIVIKPQFDAKSLYLGSGNYDSPLFKEGLSKVFVAGKPVFIDKSGRVAVKPNLNLKDQTGDWIDNFSNGMALFRKGYRFGFINKRGTIVVNAIYDYAAGFSEGLAKVTLKGQNFYIDSTGKMVIPPRSGTYGSLFINGLASVSGCLGQSSYTSYIDKNGKYLWDPHTLFDSVKVILNGELLKFESEPFIYKGRILVPVKEFSEALGATVVEDPWKRKIKITAGNKEAELTELSNTALVNGKSVNLDYILYNGDDSKSISLRFLTEFCGAQIKWDQANKVLSITLANESSSQ